MIVDCEPIRFDYDGKKWLIELWKGQYGMSCGAEIGVYNIQDQEDDRDFMDAFDQRLYACADKEDWLEMRFTLYRGGRVFLQRDQRHWWLTGFALGEFANPDDLKLEVVITLKDEEMKRAFVAALEELGYTKGRYHEQGRSVAIIYEAPLSEQPFTRTKITDEITQFKNKELCELYQRVTLDGETSLEKLEILRAEHPTVFDNALKIGNRYERK